MDTYALVRLSELLLSLVDDEGGTLLALHVALQSVIKHRIVSINLSESYLLGIMGLPVLDPVADASLVAILGTTR